MSWKLWLDDIRNAPDDSWTVARTYDEAVSLLGNQGCPSEISFDHDLGEGQPSGMEFAKHFVATDLCRQRRFIPADFRYTVHSANPCGAENIRGFMDCYFREFK